MITYLCFFLTDILTAFSSEASISTSTQHTKCIKNKIQIIGKKLFLFNNMFE